MISRHITAKMQEAEKMTQPDQTEQKTRMRRGIRKKGILPSFGDIVLPIVSVAAVGLMILAGRQFFMNGVQTSPEITSTRAYVESPALRAEREREIAAVKPAEPVSEEIAVSDDNTMLAVADIIPSEPERRTPDQTHTSTVTQTAPEKVEIAPFNKQWRIQVGAYGSRAAAKEIAWKINQAGYRAIVYSNPASRHVKVWVEGGPTRAYAERILKGIKDLGYKGSFIFPPMK